MPNVRVLSNQERALAHQWAFGVKIAQVSLSQFWVIKIILKVNIFIDIVEFR